MSFCSIYIYIYIYTYAYIYKQSKQENKHFNYEFLGYGLDNFLGIVYKVHLGLTILYNIDCIFLYLKYFLRVKDVVPMVEYILSKCESTDYKFEPPNMSPTIKHHQVEHHLGSPDAPSLASQNPDTTLPV